MISYSNVDIGIYYYYDPDDRGAIEQIFQIIECYTHDMIANRTFFNGKLNTVYDLYQRVDR